jgi:hypothetical protein
MLVMLVGAFLLGCLLGPHLSRYKLVRVDAPVGSDLRGRPVPDSDLPDSLKAPAKGSVDISDLPYPAPPCKGGAKTCNAWEREWPPGATLPAGAIVDADGTVWPKGKQ